MLRRIFFFHFFYSICMWIIGLKFNTRQISWNRKARTIICISIVFFLLLSSAIKRKWSLPIQFSLRLTYQIFSNGNLLILTERMLELLDHWEREKRTKHNWRSRLEIISSIMHLIRICPETINIFDFINRCGKSKYINVSYIC